MTQKAENAIVKMPFPAVFIFNAVYNVSTLTLVLTL